MGWGYDTSDMTRYGESQMKIGSEPGPVLVTHLFPELLERLIEVLSDLSREDWQRTASEPSWSVHDVALHLLGGDVGQISGLRDNHSTTVGRVDQWDEIVALVNDRNDEWVVATRRISPSLLVDLLRFTGEQVSRLYVPLDPNSAGPEVSWAGTGPAPMWLHVAREYTERWHHQQQIREAVGQRLLTGRRMFHPVLATFVHALPRTYLDIPAPNGTAITLTIAGDAGGAWSLVRDQDSWTLCLDDSGVTPTSSIGIPQEDAWKLFTKSTTTEAVRPRVHIEGDQSLGLKALDTVSMIV